MHPITPRETVILADDRESLARWYTEALGFRVTADHSDVQFTNLETDSGMKLGIGSVAFMQMEIPASRASAVILQIEVEDVRGFMDEIAKGDGSIVFGPDFAKGDDYWYGAIADPEGNQIWVVDPNCP